MSDWLSKIEERANKDSLGEPLFRLKDAKRMARVIRELVGLIERYAYLEAMDELTDDAKELLE